MRITQIDLKHYRGFRNEHTLELHQSGKNILIYGENGSGKSSLFHALKRFLNASEQNLVFESDRNIFADQNDGGYIKLSLHDGSQPTTYEWSAQNTIDINKPEILAGKKFSGFLEYRDILRTHLLTPGDQVNLFNLLIDTLLVDIENPLTPGTTFGQNWKALNNSIPRDNRRTSEIASLQTQIEEFNVGLAFKLQELEAKLTTVFDYFNYGNIQLSFARSNLVYLRRDQHHENRIGGQQVILQVKFCTKELTGNHPQFLNEAKLSAIGIAIYLAALLLNPVPENSLAVLVLDDVLIGLDMSNRLPVIDIIRNHFANYQIFLLTYDREWFEILCQQFVEVDGQHWKAFEFYCSDDSELEIPVIAPRGKAVSEYLRKANEYLNFHDYKAAAVYVRTAFEALIKNFCDKRSIKVPYKEKAKELKSENFWNAIESQIPTDIVKEVRIARSVVMNPLSHSRIVSVFQAEVYKAIQAVTQLQDELTANLSGEKNRSTNSVLTELQHSVGQPTATEKNRIKNLSIHRLRELQRDLSSFSSLSDLLNWLNLNAPP